MIKLQTDHIYLVECVCSHVYYSSMEENTVKFREANYPVCPVCSHREGIANMEEECLTARQSH